MARLRDVGSERSPHGKGDPSPSTRRCRRRTGMRPFLAASLALLASCVLVPTACAGESEDTTDSRSGKLVAFESLASTWEVVIRK